MLDNDIKDLIKVLEESEINELEVSTFWGKKKIRVSKSPRINSENIQISDNANLQTATKERIYKPESSETDKAKISAVESTTDNDIIQTIDSEENNVIIKAPLVGTYYQSPKPGSQPFIFEGDVIREGQVICIIEAMKIFNEIESEISGTIVKILIQDNSPVEFDQDLLIVKPNRV